MVLSSDKCYYLILGFNGSFPDFPFNDLTTESVTEGKILGIKIDSKLNFKSQLIRGKSSLKTWCTRKYIKTKNS